MTNDSEQDNEQLKIALEHAWNWFSLHANQRLQSVNFFLVATAFLSAAFVTAAKEDMYDLAAGVAVLAVLISFYFYRMERRIRTLLHAAEGVLEPLESKLAESLQVDALRIVAKVEDERPGEWKYSKVFRYLYLSTSVAFGVGLLYAIWSVFSKIPGSTAFSATVESMVGILLIAAGYELQVSLSTSKVDDGLQTAQRVSTLVSGIACVIGGLIVIGHLVFVRL
jgi:hypothetical protein